MITGAVVSGATELRVDDIPLSTTKQSGSRAEAQETTAVCAHLRRCHKGARRLARAPVRRTPPTSRAGGSPALCRARQRFFGNLHPKMIKNTPGDCRLLPNYYFDCRLQSDSQINVHPPCSPTSGGAGDWAARDSSARRHFPCAIIGERLAPRPRSAHAKAWRRAGGAWLATAVFQAFAMRNNALADF